MTELEKLREEVAALRAKVAELEEQERELEEKTRRYRFISELVSDRVCTLEVGERGELRLGDPVIGEIGAITGYTVEEVRTPDQWKRVVHPGDWDKIVQGLRFLFEGKRHETEVRLVGKTGRVTWHRITGIPDWDEEKNRLKSALWAIRDIGDKKRAEEEMLRLERLRALGRMAAGVSHNLNNILTTILGPAWVLRSELKDSALRVEAESILKSARRASALVKRLNAAVKGVETESVEPVSVNRAVEEALALTRSLWKDEPESRGVEIAVEKDLGEVGDVLGTLSGLSDVVVNLLLNALDALPEGGTICIRTWREEGCVVLSVKDNGVGMDEGIKARVFEPFFTTKSDLGTGLGLSTVNAIVTKWGGRIEVESEPGLGSEFRVWLPEVREGGGRGSRRRPGKGRGPRGRVMIVEDVERARVLLAEVLSQDHEVRTFSGGPEAIAGFEARRYDVAVIALGMSEITGDRLARFLRQKDPFLSTVLVCAEGLEPDDPRAAGFDFLLQEPLGDPERLRRVVAEAVRLRRSRREEKR